MESILTKIVSKQLLQIYDKLIIFYLNYLGNKDGKDSEPK